MALKTKVKALLTLLDDPDCCVYEAVEKEIIKHNTNLIPALEELWESSLDEMAQSRIENLIQYLQFKGVKKELGSWARKKDADLFEGLFIVNKFQYPDYSFDKIERKIAKIQKAVWLELKDSLTSLEKTSVLNHIFFEKEGFGINHSNLQSPQNSFISQVLETKKGNPTTIALLYSLVARSLGLPIYFIDFPRNPLLAYFDHDIAVKAHGPDIDSDILFYINPSNRGAITGRKELEYHLQKISYDNDRKYFERGDDRLFIKRLVTSLKTAYESIGYKEKSKQVAELKSILEKYK